MNLSEIERAFIRKQMDGITRIAASCEGSPFDPKVEVLLEMAHALLEEQIELDKKYGKWGPATPRDDRFIDKTTDIPSAEDIKRMMEGE